MTTLIILLSIHFAIGLFLSGIYFEKYKYEDTAKEYVLNMAILVLMWLPFGVIAHLYFMSALQNPKKKRKNN